MTSAGDVVVVTGASSGTGRATAVRFGRGGAAVLAVGRDEAALSATARAIESAGGRASACAADVTAPDSADLIVEAALTRYGAISTLVNAVPDKGARVPKCVNDGLV